MTFTSPSTLPARSRRAGLTLTMTMTLALACLVAVPRLAAAIPVMDMHVEDMLAMAPDFQAQLSLNRNQKILWQQMEAKTRQLVRSRKARRDRLEAALKQQLAGKSVELRDLVAGVDAETATSAAEATQLRAWWLEVNDALDETQRQTVATFLGEQLLRVLDGGPPAGGGSRGKEEGGPGGGRGGRGGSGGSGMGGVGVGGVNVNMPGG